MVIKDLISMLEHFKSLNRNKIEIDLILKNLKEIEQTNTNGFKFVKDSEPPKNGDLIVKDPKGNIYLTGWREGYRIFMCQNKQEDSSDWQWKFI